MANKIVLKLYSLATSDYFWLLLATKRVRGCRTFVSDKAEEAWEGDL